MFSGFLDSPIGKIVISIILGFGLATIFRKVCRDNNCIMITGPKIADTDKYYYKIDDDCFKYKPYVTSCN